MLNDDIIPGYDLQEIEEEGFLICVTEKKSKAKMDKFIKKMEVL